MEIIENTFLTGAAGTGKSYNINKLTMNTHKTIALTATTGLAAVNIGGQTLHSFLRLGLLKEPTVKEAVTRILKRDQDFEAIKATDIIVIDECSMLDGFIFEVVNEVLKGICKNNLPFGGKKILLVGDLYQIPPVEVETKNFFFEADIFKTANFKSIVLEKIYRQNDKKFIKLLNKIREGKQDKKDLKLLETRQFNNLNYANLDTTCLFSTNQQANELNEYRLQELKNKEILLKSIDEDHRSFLISGVYPPPEVFRAPNVLRLKQGCKVLLLKNFNIDLGICNGSTGTFLKYDESSDVVFCEFNGHQLSLRKEKFEYYQNGQIVYTRNQFPIRLGYGITIHSSQGMTLDSAAIDFKRTFASGQSYVALSRVKTFESLYLKNVEYANFHINPKVKKFMENISNAREMESISD